MDLLNSFTFEMATDHRSLDFGGFTLDEMHLFFLFTRLGLVFVVPGVYFY